MTLTLHGLFNTQHVIQSTVTIMSFPVRFSLSTLTAMFITLAEQNDN
jgi:hypothetical protein